MKSILLYLFILTSTLQLTAQVNIDSLFGIWNDKSQPDTTRLEAMLDICLKGYVYSNPDSAFYYAQKQYDLAKKINNKKYEAIALNTQGISFWAKSDYQKAIEYYDKGYHIRKEMGDRNGMASSLNNIAMINKEQGKIALAIDNYTKALKIKEELGDKNSTANILNNIGSIYYSQGDVQKSLEYFNKSLSIKEELGDKKGISTILNNLGSIYIKNSEHEKALDYLNRCLKIKEEIDDKNGAAMTLSNIGNIYGELKNYDKALEYHLQGLKIREEIGNKFGVANSLSNISALYQVQGDFKTAIKYANQAITLANEIGSISETEYPSKILFECYKKQGKYKDALAMFELYISMKDSLYNEETQKEVIKQEMQYEYEKKKAIDEKENEKQLAIAEEQKQRQKIISYAIALGLILVLIFAFFVINRLRITRKQKQVIELQKTEVETQKQLVDEKNQEITDSITYAKRIQEAILPPTRLVKECLPDSFIVYKPKDIVAGDFYWIESIPNPSKGGAKKTTGSPPQGESEGAVVLFAAADCTGHGVPGAMVSVVCHNAMNRAVREFKLTEPAQILNKTRDLVIETFMDSDKEVKDGMDIALCSLNLKTNELNYSGANNSLYYIRDNKLTEIKADKQPVGQFTNNSPFTNHKLSLEKGDSIYIFSDGFADQFGGPKGKKFMYKPFRELLLSIQDKSMQEQREIIGETFENWKGNLEQIDDICIIGVQI